MNINALKALIASGQITPDQLSQMNITSSPEQPQMQPQQPMPQQNALAQMIQRPSTEELAPIAGGGFQGLQSGQGVVQSSNPDGSQNTPIYIDTPPGQDRGMDVTRPQIEIAGMGKGYYSKDGRSANINGQNVMLGVDREATDARNDRQLKRQMQMAQMDETKARTAQLNARATPEQPKPIWDADRGVFITPPSNGMGPQVTQVNGLSQKPKALTEDERRSAGLAVRMENSLRAMDEIGKDAPDALKPQLLSRMAEGMGADMLANTLNSSPRRQVEATQLDALDAALTLATGAAYTKEQLKSLSKSYFPQIGDAPQDIEFKKNLLNNVIQTARIRSGGAEGSINKVLDNSNRPKVESSAPPAAVEYLRANPKMRAAFEMKYGKGSAASALGE